MTSSTPTPASIVATAALTLLVLAGRFVVVRPKVLATQLGPRVVEMQYGKLRGVLITLTNRHLPLVDAYYGLPYASVLGGELRFMPPTSTTEKWDGIRVALKFRPVCPQPVDRVAKAAAEAAAAARDANRGLGAIPHWTAEQADRFARLLPFVERQNEECLNLNVYVPVVGENTFVVIWTRSLKNKNSIIRATFPCESRSNPTVIIIILAVLCVLDVEFFALNAFVWSWGRKTVFRW
jgi:hypothetical protein